MGYQLVYIILRPSEPNQAPLRLERKGKRSIRRRKDTINEKIRANCQLISYVGAAGTCGQSCNANTDTCVCRRNKEKENKLASRSAPTRKHIVNNVGSTRAPIICRGHTAGHAPRGPLSMPTHGFEDGSHACICLTLPSGTDGLVSHFRSLGRTQLIIIVRDLGLRSNSRSSTVLLATTSRVHIYLNVDLEHACMYRCPAFVWLHVNHVRNVLMKTWIIIR
jgi:hypothetical protein